MVRALSYIIAVIITVTLAIFLYPIAALFWVFGLLGKVSSGLFAFTKRTISALWRDLRMSGQVYANTPNQTVESGNAWTCHCGNVNMGKFCSGCGSAKPEPIVETVE
jgi:hypothetical protein